MRGACFIRCLLFLVLHIFALYGTAERADEISAEMRPLIRVRDSVITVVDVMKKMDLVFYQQYPQYRSSVRHRLEFYQSSWMKALRDILERKVIMIFADENKMDVGHGDVREEMEELFGPNVLLKLYEAGVTLDDAYEMVRQDIMMRRILQFYVRMPAVATITPQKIKERYVEQYENKTKGDKLSWKILSFRVPENLDAQQVSTKIIDSLNRNELNLERAKEKIPDGCECILSPQYITEIEQLAPSIRQTLESTPFGVWTIPQQAKEGKKGMVKWSSYLVDKKIPGEKISLNLVENEIVEELAQPLIEEKKKSFMEGLMKKFDVSFVMPEKEMESFKPFRLTHASL